jgi:transposase
MKSRQSYLIEFRAEAVKLVLEQGLNQREAADRLGISKGTLGNWVQAAKRGGEKPALGARSVTELGYDTPAYLRELADRLDGLEGHLDRQPTGSPPCSGREEGDQNDAAVVSKPVAQRFHGRSGTSLMTRALGCGVAC